MYDVLCLCVFSPNDDSMCDEKSVEKKKKIFSHMKMSNNRTSLYDVCISLCVFGLFGEGTE